MDTESKVRENEFALTSTPQSECEECQPITSKETPVDLFVIHGHKNESATVKPSTDTQIDISIERASETDYGHYRVLFENRIAEAALRVAHELNNPLATILVYAQILLSRGNMDEVTRDGLQIIFSEAQNVSLVTTSLFFFARREKPEKQLISIQEALQRTIELRIANLMSNDIGLITKLQPDIPKTMADPYQVQQLFTNIINNAEQVMLEAHGKGTLQISAQQVGEMVKITFQDDGPGIPRQNLKRIFEPFFTTKSVGLGLGLGLSICCSIVEAHGGNIYALSEDGQGASIIVELPIAI
jgi:two-component system NtrC family sensor kinase